MHALAIPFFWSLTTFPAQIRRSTADPLRIYGTVGYFNGNELYNSNEMGGRDARGKGTVLTVELVINGRVYLAAQKQVAILN